MGDGLLKMDKDGISGPVAAHRPCSTMRTTGSSQRSMPTSRRKRRKMWCWVPPVASMESGRCWKQFQGQVVRPDIFQQLRKKVHHCWQHDSKKGYQKLGHGQTYAKNDKFINLDIFLYIFIICFSCLLRHLVSSSRSLI